MSEGLIVHENPQMPVSSGKEVLSASLENGSEEIRKQLYALLEEVRHRPYVYFKGKIKPQDYNDVINELAVKIGHMKPEQLLKIEHLTSYFSSMIRSASLDFFRTHGNRTTEDLGLFQDVLPSNEPNPESLAISAQIRSIIHSLSSGNKQALELDLQGFSDEEIAGQLGVTPQAVKARLY